MLYALVGVYLARSWWNLVPVCASTCSLLAVIIQSVLLWIGRFREYISADLGMRGGSPLYWFLCREQ